MSQAVYITTMDPLKGFHHQGESCVNRRRLTSRQANVEHMSYSCLTPNPVTSTNIGSPVPSTQIPHHLIIPQPSN
ncbi:hypothetical protein O181_118475, partial [Austropuccinia psidii MF-1]|nr:hypothetical protein [Austropuccinia psidii MF-1]